MSKFEDCIGYLGFNVSEIESSIGWIHDIADDIRDYYYKNIPIDDEIVNGAADALDDVSTNLYQISYNINQYMNDLKDILESIQKDAQ